MPVEVRHGQHRVRLDTRRLRKVAHALLKALGKEEASLSILLTDDRKMAQLHERWMGESGPTDVLSFPQGENRQLGDIAISVETAARRAPEDVATEINRYLVHGLLHLMGQDHLRKRDRRRMNQEAKRLHRYLAKNV